MSRPRWLFTVLIPLVWGLICTVNFFAPGDEYSGWAAGSLPGLWIVPLLPSGGSPSGLLPRVALAGMASMALLGFAMDKLRPPSVVWSALIAVLSTAIFSHALWQYPSLARAIAKNGSLEAYMWPSVNLGLFFSTVLMVVATGLYRIGTWLWSAANRIRGKSRPTFG